MSKRHHFHRGELCASSRRFDPNSSEVKSIKENSRLAKEGMDLVVPEEKQSQTNYFIEDVSIVVNVNSDKDLERFNRNLQEMISQFLKK